MVLASHLFNIVLIWFSMHRIFSWKNGTFYFLYKYTKILVRHTLSIIINYMWIISGRYSCTICNCLLYVRIITCGHFYCDYCYFWYKKKCGMQVLKNPLAFLKSIGWAIVLEIATAIFTITTGIVSFVTKLHYMKL